MKKKGLLILVIGFVFVFEPLSAQTWLSAKRLTWNSGPSGNPAMATSLSDIIHIVWLDFTPGNYEIYYKRGTYQGVIWESNKRLTWSFEHSYHPAIAIDSSNHIHVVWFEGILGGDEIYYKRSTNGGVTWGSSKRLTWNSSDSEFPKIAVDSSNNIHVVWYSDTPGNREIYYKRSTDGGGTWGSSRRLTWTSGSSYYPKIAVDSSDNIHVVWNDYTPSNSEIYYKKSTNGGMTWGSSKRLTWNLGESAAPAIATDSSTNIHGVWNDDTPGNSEIYYKKGTDGGGTWGSSKRLTWNSGLSYQQATLVDSSNNIHVVWNDGTPGNSEIFYRRSTNGGMTWGSSKSLTWNSGLSYDLVINVDSSTNIHVAWGDNTPGNWEVYYRKGIQ